MWGNLTGWGISALIVLLVGGWVYLIERGSARTQPTSFSSNQAYFEPFRLPERPAALGATKDADAGPLYHRAIDLYLDDRALYTNFAAIGKLGSPDAPRLSAIDALVEAAPCRSMTLFAAEPALLVNYNLNKPPIEALENLGRVCVDRLALLNQRAGRKEEAAKFYRAGFALGYHLCSERVTYDELNLGLQLLGKTGPMLAKLSTDAGDTSAAKEYEEFEQRRLKFASGLEPVLGVVRAMDAKRVGTHVGDLFELARHANGRMWRVEAMLALGRVRHFAGQGGTAADQRAATAFLRHAAETEQDPVVRAAAAAARDLTVEQHRMQ